MRRLPPAPRLLLLLLAQPGVALVVFSLFTTGMGWLAWHVDFDGSTQRILVQTPEQQAYQARMQEIFGGDHTVFIGLHPPSGDVFQHRVLHKIDRLSRALEILPGVTKVTSLTQVGVIRGTPEGLEVRPLLPEIPDDDRSLAEARREALDNRLLRANLISTDARYTALVVDLDPSPASLAIRPASLNAIRTIAYHARGPEEIVVAGAPMVGHAFRHLMAQDLLRLVPCTVVLVGVTLWALFRRMRAVVLPLIAVSASMVWTLGLMRLLHVPLSMVTTALPPVLIAVGVAYGVHVVAAYWGQLRSGSRERGPSRRTMTRVAWPVALSATTTIAGFGSISLSDVRTLQEFGFFSMAGVLFCAIASVTVVPIALRLFPIDDWEARRRKRHPWSLERWLRRAGDLTDRERLGITTAAALILALSVMGILRLQADTDYLGYIAPREPIRQAVEFFNEHLAGANTFTVVFEGAGENRFKEPDALAFLGGLQEFIAHQPGVDTTTSLADYVKVMNRALHDDAPQAERLPDTAAEIGQLLLLFSLGEDTGLLNQYVNYDFSAARLAYRGHLTSSRAQVALAKRIDSYCRQHLPPGITARQTGSAYYLAQSSMGIVRSQLRSLGVSALIIGAIMLVLFRSPVMTVLVLVPNVLPIAMILAMMGWLGIPLSTGTAVIASISLGIAVDDTIHLVLRYYHELLHGGHGPSGHEAPSRMDRLAAQREAMRVALLETGRPIFYSSATLVVGFVVLIASSFTPILMLGLLTAATMVFCLFGDLLLLPAMLTLVPVSRRLMARAEASSRDATPVITDEPVPTPTRPWRWVPRRPPLPTPFGLAPRRIAVPRHPEVVAPVVPENAIEPAAVLVDSARSA
jgi:predicted RND superfamily exporter protein